MKGNKLMKNLFYGIILIFLINITGCSSDKKTSSNKKQTPSSKKVTSKPHKNKIPNSPKIKKGKQKQANKQKQNVSFYFDFKTIKNLPFLLKNRQKIITAAQKKVIWECS